MSNIKTVGASDSPATFSHPELSKPFNIFAKNSPTEVDAKVGLSNIEFQEFHGSSPAPGAFSMFLNQTSQLKVNIFPVQTPRTYVGLDAQLHSLLDSTTVR
jgi:hypothetical protein